MKFACEQNFEMALTNNTVEVFTKDSNLVIIKKSFWMYFRLVFRLETSRKAAKMINLALQLIYTYLFL